MHILWIHVFDSSDLTLPDQTVDTRNHILAALMGKLRVNVNEFNKKIHENLMDMFQIMRQSVSLRISN